MSEGRKYDKGKLRYDLIPPEALEELARVYTIGAKKYGDRNWQKGIALDRIYAAIMRHLEARRKGELVDKENGQQHAASIAWGAFAILYYDINRGKEVKDYEEVRRDISDLGCPCGQCRVLSETGDPKV